MRPAGPLALLAVLAVPAAGPAAAAGQSRARDLAATAAYLRAGYTFESAFERVLPAERAAGAAVSAGVQASCHGVLAAASEQQLSGQFSEALLDSTGLAVLGPLHEAIARFSAATRRLRWNSRTLTGGVRRQAAEDRAELELAPLDLCRVAREWRASAFGTLPAPAHRLLDRLHQLADPRALGVLQAPSRLRTVTPPRARPLLHRLQALQTRFREDILTLVFGAFGEAESGLVGHPPPPPRTPPFPASGKSK